MNTIPFRELKTKRLHLRRLQESDWQAVSYLRTDPDVNKYVKRPNAETKEKALEFIQRINYSGEEQNYYWCISMLNDPKMIGSICLWNFNEDQNVAEVGYDLATNYHGKGIMSEAIKMILGFGFNMLNLERIEAYTQRNNKSSRHLLEKNGFIWAEDRSDEDNADNVIYEIRKGNR